MAKRLHVVHDRRTHVETEDGGEIRRLDARIGAFAFERFDQSGFLAANVSARAAVNVNFDVEPSAEHVGSDEIFLARFFDGALENLCAFGKFAADIDVGSLRVQRETGDQDPFDQLMRVLVNNVAILERPGFRFVRVAD